MSYLNPDTDKDKVKTETEKHEMNFFALNRYVERMLGGTLGEKKYDRHYPD